MTSAGTIKKPPPTPNSPDSNPVSVPAKVSRSAQREVNCNRPPAS